MSDFSPVRRLSRIRPVLLEKMAFDARQAGDFTNAVNYAWQGHQIYQVTFDNQILGNGMRGDAAYRM